MLIFFISLIKVSKKSCHTDQGAGMTARLVFGMTSLD